MNPLKKFVECFVIVKQDPDSKTDKYMTLTDIKSGWKGHPDYNCSLSLKSLKSAIEGKFGNFISKSDVKVDDKTKTVRTFIRNLKYNHPDGELDETETKDESVPKGCKL